jgi:hypothetical protein
MARRPLRALLLLVLVSAVPAPAGAATMTVTCDGGAAAQLAGFVAGAASGDIILIPACTVPVGTVLFVGTNLTIAGTGPQSILEGGGTDGVITVGAGVFASVSGLTIRNGRAVFGAGIANLGTLTLTAVTITGNSAGTFSSQGQGGGLFNSGDLTLSHSTISDNAASGIADFGGGGEGAGVYNSGTLRMTHTTVSGNRARVATSGGVGSARGGGIFNSGVLTASGSTVSGNFAEGGSASVDRGGAIWNTGSLDLTNATIVNNAAAANAFGNTVGGLQASGSASQTLRNTLLAGNTNNCGLSGTSTFSFGHNLSSDTTCASVFNAAGDLNGLPGPHVGPLRNNGGATPTHALLPLSPAVDGGDNVGCPVTDQRDRPRPVDGNGDGVAQCDIGAVEVRGPVVVSAGTGAGGAPHVKLFRVDGAGNATQLGGGFFAYDPGFLGGVQATLVEVGGQTFIVTGVGSGGGPHVKLFAVTDLAAGTVTQIGPGFLAYDPGFTGGARLAATVGPAGSLVIVTGVGSGGASHVKLFEVTDLATGDVQQVGGGFFAYDPAFLGGVNVGVE